MKLGRNCTKSAKIAYFWRISVPHKLLGSPDDGAREVDYFWAQRFKFLITSFYKLYIPTKFSTKQLKSSNIKMRFILLGKYIRITKNSERTNSFSMFDTLDTVVSPNKGTQIREFFPYLHQNWEILQIRECPNFPNLVKNLMIPGQFFAE